MIEGYRGGNFFLDLACELIAKLPAELKPTIDAQVEPLRTDIRPALALQLDQLNHAG